jgi:hypothetical protein
MEISAGQPIRARPVRGRRMGTIGRTASHPSLPLSIDVGPRRSAGARPHHVLPADRDRGGRPASAEQQFGELKEQEMLDGPNGVTAV